MFINIILASKISPQTKQRPQKSKRSKKPTKHDQKLKKSKEHEKESTEDEKESTEHEEESIEDKPHKISKSSKDQKKKEKTTWKDIVYGILGVLFLGACIWLQVYTEKKDGLRGGGGSSSSGYQAHRDSREINNAFITGILVATELQNNGAQNRARVINQPLTGTVIAQNTNLQTGIAGGTNVNGIPVGIPVNPLIPSFQTIHVPGGYQEIQSALLNNMTEDEKKDIKNVHKFLHDMIASSEIVDKFRVEYKNIESLAQYINTDTLRDQHNVFKESLERLYKLTGDKNVQAIYCLQLQEYKNKNGDEITLYIELGYDDSARRNPELLQSLKEETRITIKSCYLRLYMILECCMITKKEIYIPYNHDQSPLHNVLGIDDIHAQEDNNFKDACDNFYTSLKKIYSFDTTTKKKALMYFEKTQFQNSENQEIHVKIELEPPIPEAYKKSYQII